MTETEKKDIVERMKKTNDKIEKSIDRYLEIILKEDSEEKNQAQADLFGLFDDQFKNASQLNDYWNAENLRKDTLRERFLTAQTIAENLERYQKIRRITFGFRD